MKNTIEGVHGLVIEKYSMNNIIVFAGLPGSGKTYQIEKAVELELTKKLLLASVEDCQYEYLKVNNLTKLSYYDTLITPTIEEKFISLLTILKTQVKENYDVIIIDNFSFNTYQQIFKLLNVCSLYPDTKFFITLDNNIKLNGENREFDSLFLEKRIRTD